MAGKFEKITGLVRFFFFSVSAKFSILKGKKDGATANHLLHLEFLHVFK